MQQGGRIKIIMMKSVVCLYTNNEISEKGYVKNTFQNHNPQSEILGNILLQEGERLTCPEL